MSRPDPTRPFLGRIWLLILTASVALAAPLQAQDRPDGWDPDEVLERESFTEPPGEIADAVLAPRWLNVELSDLAPGGSWFLEQMGDGPVSMDRFSRPFHDLGGQFIELAANRDRALFTRSDAGIRLVSATDGTVREVEVPRGARVSNASWSPDGSRLAFFAHTDDAVHLYVAGTDGQARRVCPRPVLATGFTDFTWSSGTTPGRWPSSTPRTATSPRWVLR